MAVRPRDLYASISRTIGISLQFLARFRKIIRPGKSRHHPSFTLPAGMLMIRSIAPMRIVRFNFAVEGQAGPNHKYFHNRPPSKPVVIRRIANRELL